LSAGKTPFKELSNEDLFGFIKNRGIQIIENKCPEAM
jgi:hypothetical protein